MSISSFEGLGQVVRHPLTLRVVSLVSLASIALTLGLDRRAQPGPEAMVICAGQQSDSVRYDGLSAVLVHPGNDAQLELVIEVARDVWTDARGLTNMVVVVDAAGQQALRDAGLSVEVQIADIQAVADAEHDRLQQANAHRPSDWFAEYKTYDAVNEYAGQLAERHADLATIREIGETVEGRSIRALRITNPKRHAANKTTIVLNGGQHAREWISVMTTTCIADRLIRRAPTDERVARALDNHEFVIVPIVNPDGYVYSWEHDRYWRKNRGGRFGVDLNRNWDWEWGRAGSSSNPRSQIYAGPRAFSEPETRALRDLIIAEAPVAHVDLHSYSQLIIYPWSHKRGAAPDQERFAGYADRMASAIYATHQKSYETLAGAQLYVASGTMSDWAYGAHEVASFVFELRPPAKGGGFVLPPEQIVPTCDEAFNAILELAELVEN